jgi:hypothetical protein
LAAKQIDEGADKPIEVEMLGERQIDQRAHLVTRHSVAWLPGNLL